MAVCLPDGFRNIHLHLRLPEALLEALSTCRAMGWLETVWLLSRTDAKCSLIRCITARSKVCLERDISIRKNYQSRWTWEIVAVAFQRGKCKMV